MRRKRKREGSLTGRNPIPSTSHSMSRDVKSNVCFQKTSVVCPPHEHNEFQSSNCNFKCRELFCRWVTYRARSQITPYMAPVRECSSQFYLKFVVLFWLGIYSHCMLLKHLWMWVIHLWSMLERRGGVIGTVSVPLNGMCRSGVSGWQSRQRAGVVLSF